MNKEQPGEQQREVRRREWHSFSYTKQYFLWQRIKGRCTNKRNKDFVDLWRTGNNLSQRVL